MALPPPERSGPESRTSIGGPVDDVTRVAIEDLRRRVACLEARDNPLAKMAEAIRNMPPARPEGEQNDRETVTKLRKLLADIFLDVFDENLSMRPTLELVDIMGNYLRDWKPRA